MGRKVIVIILLCAGISLWIGDKENAIVFPTKDNGTNSSKNILIFDMTKANIKSCFLIDFLQIDLSYIVTSRNLFSAFPSYNYNTIWKFCFSGSQFGNFIINFLIIHNPHMPINFSENCKGFAFINYRDFNLIIPFFDTFNILSRFWWRVAFYF